MERERRNRSTDEATAPSARDAGKRTRSERLPVQRQDAGRPIPAAEAIEPRSGVASGDDPFGMHLIGTPVQRRGDDAHGPEVVHAAAARGVAGPAQPLPFLDQIQSSFGATHDVSHVRAHVGGPATEAAAAMGASAYASGDHVAFAAPPDRHTAAHEAAHVVQQARGVALYGGVGDAGDAYERQADEVADRVVAGRSAADLLAPITPVGGGPAVQRRSIEDAGVDEPAPEESMPLPGEGPSDTPAEQDPAIVAAAEAELLGEAGLDDDAPPETALAAAPAPGAALDAAAASDGRPLPSGLRARLERQARAPLGHVRIHDDAAAGTAAQAVAAKAFTQGGDIYFAPGAYEPESTEGLQLIAHEVLHTLQPEAGTPDGVTNPGDKVEHEAEAFSARFTGGGRDLDATDDTAEHIDAAEELEGNPTAPPALSPRTALPRYPGVVTEAFNEDKVRFIDPSNESLGKVWQEDRGYIKNSTAKPLSSVIKNGKVGGGFENGTFMYVVDDKGEVWVGKRQGKNMPHPTLIGGKAPQVQAAGMVRIEGGKIVKIDNHSGHFRPPRGSLSSALKSYLKLPKDAFKNFKAESVHFDGNGVESRKRFNSLRMLKLKSFNPGKTLNRIKMRYKHDPKFKGRLKGAGRAGLAIIAMLIADYFIGKWMAEMEAEQIREAIARLAPTVEAALLASLEAQADTFDKLYEANPDAEIHLNVVYRLAHITAYYQSGMDVATAEAFAGLELKSAEVSLSPITEGLKHGGMDACIGSTTTYQDYSMSEAVKLSDLYDDDAGAASDEKDAP